MNDLSFGTRKGPRPIPAWDRMDNRGIDKPAPAPQQVARKYCVILLKGMQTRWADTEEEVGTLLLQLSRDGHAHIAFRYSSALESYSVLLDEAAPCTISAP